MISAFESFKDSIGVIESWYAFQLYDGCVRTPEQGVERIKAVTRSQVAECARLARLDTVYMLAPEASEETNESEGGQGDD